MKRKLSLLMVLALVSVNKVKAYDNYSFGEAIYFNPTTGYLCEKKDAVSTTGLKKGCMKWYVISHSGSENKSIDVILDHNITKNTTWTEIDGYDDNNANIFPTNITVELKNNTSDWKNVNNVRNLDAAKLIYDITGKNFNYNASSHYENNGNIEDKKFADTFYFYKDLYKSRTVESTATYTYELQSTNANSSEKTYAWLLDNTKDCKSNGCNKEDSQTIGYWTSNAGIYINQQSYVNNTGAASNYTKEYNVYSITNDGTFSPKSSYVSDIGLRPVVTINKEDLKKEPEEIKTEKEKETNTKNVTIKLSEEDIAIKGNIFIKTSSEEKNVTENSTLKVSKVVSDEKVYENVKSELKTKFKKSSFKFMIYDISIYNNNNKIQPSDKVTLTLPIPDKYDKNKISIYHIEEDNSLKELKYTISDNNLLVEVDHFSLFVITEDNSKTEIVNPKTGIRKISNYIIGLVVVTFGVYLSVNKKIKFIK